ncbi:MAG: thiamine pyrophosphate-dependent enzyme, partial [Deltaproteobacteria bacterium]|nr:thiamine pyrophosphate-dependent enzyme [Deltaproteobacteria bacterium]
GIAGDGGTADIGIQALSGAIDRRDKIIYVCYDNEAYMNTGIQRSSATPQLAWTTTTPSQTPKAERKKNMIEIMAAHRIPYTATANVAYPDDLMRKVKTAMGIKGMRFIHILAPCPPGWKISSDYSIKIARLATESRYFPLYEVYNGEEYVINYEPKGIPVKEYMKQQARFSHITDEEYKSYQEFVDREWDRLKLKVTMNELLKKRSASS